MLHWLVLWLNYMSSGDNVSEGRDGSIAFWLWRWLGRAVDWYGGGEISTSTTSTITVGQVDIDMYDPTAKKLVWRRTATKTLDLKAKPEKRDKNLRKGVAKLLKNYPLPPKKS